MTLTLVALATICAGLFVWCCALTAMYRANRAALKDHAIQLAGNAHHLMDQEARLAEQARRLSRHGRP